MSNATHPIPSRSASEKAQLIADAKIALETIDIGSQPTYRLSASHWLFSIAAQLLEIAREEDATN